MRSTIRSLLLILAVFAIHKTLNGQSLGSGAVTFTDHIGDYYVNLSGELDIDYVFIDNQPIIKLRWQWAKVNSVQYDGVDYNATNNQLDPSLFDYKKSSFWGNVTVLDDAPTRAGYVEVSQDIYAGQVFTSFNFDVNLEKWRALSMEERARLKKEWEYEYSPMRLTLNTIKGSIVKDVFRAIKNQIKEKEAEQKKIDEVKDAYKRLESSYNSIKQHLGNNKTGLSTLNKYYLKASNLESQAAPIHPATSQNAARLQDDIKDAITQLKSSLKQADFDETIAEEESKSSRQPESNKESIYQKRQREAAAAKRREQEYNNAYQEKANTIVRQGAKRIEKMQGALDTWNSTMDGITAQMQKNHEREDRLLEQKRQERLRKEKIEQERYAREREQRRREQERREQIRNKQDRFMDDLGDVQIPLNTDYEIGYAIFISKVRYNEISIVPATLYKNEDNQLPYKQDIINKLWKERQFSRAKAYGIYATSQDFEKALKQLKNRASENEIQYGQLKEFISGAPKSEERKPSNGKSFWDN